MPKPTIKPAFLKVHQWLQNLSINQQLSKWTYSPLNNVKIIPDTVNLANYW